MDESGGYSPARIQMLARGHTIYGTVSAIFAVLALISVSLVLFRVSWSGTVALDQPDGAYAVRVLTLSGAGFAIGLALALTHLALARQLVPGENARLCRILAGVTILGIPVGTALAIWTFIVLHQEAFEPAAVPPPSAREPEPTTRTALTTSVETADADNELRDLPVSGPERRFPDLSIWALGPWILVWLLSFWILTILIEPVYRWGFVRVGFVAARGYHPTYDRQALYALLITVALYIARTFVLPRLRSRFRDRA